MSSLLTDSAVCHTLSVLTNTTRATGEGTFPLLSVSLILKLTDSNGVLELTSVVHVIYSHCNIQSCKKDVNLVIHLFNVSY